MVSLWTREREAIETNSQFRQDALMHRVSLLLMRHAKSSWGTPDLSDHDRPLNKRGRWAAPLMGRMLLEHDLVPDLVCLSTALRVQQTAEEVLAACGYRGEILTTRRLYLAEPPAYFDVFAEVPDGKKRVLVIAHNPGIADICEMLSRQFVEMCTAGIAQIECQESEIAAISSKTPGRLEAFYRPPKGGPPE